MGPAGTLWAEEDDYEAVFPADPRTWWGRTRDLLTYWNTMSGKVQLRLLESGLSVSTLGELKMLQEQIEHEG